MFVVASSSNNNVRVNIANQSVYCRRYQITQIKLFMNYFHAQLPGVYDAVFNAIESLVHEALNLLVRGKSSMFIYNTIETHIKEPFFTRTARLKFNILNSLNKNLSEAGTGAGSYIADFLSSEILRNLKNS